MTKWPTESEIAALPNDGGRLFNRLIFEDRLYLKSHAHQAINWYPWGQAAFELATITNKPLFLSIGYSSCHWCHVMAKTTFDHPDVAKLLNQNFVAIKIDKDQYPDVDQLYMNATQLLTQHGGWPNSVFCLPTGEPFFAGTYFPAEDHPNGPGFLTLLSEMAHAWQNNQVDIKRQAKDVEKAILSMNQLHQQPNQRHQLRQCYQAAIDGLCKQFDPIHGGFGGSPKFPPFSALRLLVKTEPTIVEKTLNAMALSGLYDHVEGGFHRYCTDAHWHLPHFEKILMDNAQMIELYAIMHQKKPSPLFQRVVNDTIHHLQTKWTRTDGGFCSTMDADSNGKEGQYYAISMKELKELANESTIAQWSDYFQLTAEGNLHDEATKAPTGLNIFHPIDADPPFSLTQFQDTLAQFRHDHRTQPALDPAFVPHANAWLAKALIIAGQTFNVSTWITLAERTLDVVMDHIRHNETSVYADDVTHALSACLTSNSRPKDVAYLWQVILDQFYDPIHGGLWYTQDTHLIPITRIKDSFDRQAPSPNGLFIQCAIQMHAASKTPQHLKLATETLMAFLSTCNQSPIGHETYWLAMDDYWRLFNTPKAVQMQLAICQKESDNTFSIELNFTLSNGLFLNASSPISFSNTESVDWLQYLVTPCSSRRVEWSSNIMETASGTIHLKGRFRMNSTHDAIDVLLPICTTTHCMPPITVHVPVY